MDITRGYKYRIYPNTAQEHKLLRFFGCCGFVYNHFLEARRRSYEENGVTMSYTATSVMSH